MSGEKVLAIPTKKLYEKGKWSGFRTSNLSWYRRLVNNNAGFFNRSKIETDASLKQIIPQVLFLYKNKIFFHQITPHGEESRLHNLYPIFLGGHVNPIDAKPGQDLVDAAAEREFYEEVEYNGKFLSKKFVGVVNKLTGNQVNEVHVGFVFIFRGDSGSIKTREKQAKNIGLLTLEELKPYVNKMTYWSRLVFPHLKKLI